MIIVRLMGGLGNQLFQYALGRTLALRNKTELKLDTSEYQRENSFRKFRLEFWNIKATIASFSERDTLTKFSWHPFFRRPYRLIERCLPLSKQKIVLEKTHRYDPEIHLLTGNKYLIGFWQTEKYFAEIAPALLREFTLKNKPSEYSLQLAEDMREVDSVSIHIRRTDYLTNPPYFANQGICSLDYYYSAAEQLVSHLPSPHIYVFSDDMEWSQSNLRLNYPTTFVTQNSAERDYEDLWLMSRCKHHIIANSSFSWWGAWLSENPDKIIYAPRVWSTNTNFDWSDLVPNGWQRV